VSAAHANPRGGFPRWGGRSAYDGEPDDCTIEVRRTGKVTHLIITPFYSGRSGTTLDMHLPTDEFDRISRAD
jgi:hypothetical protein